MMDTLLPDYAILAVFFMGFGLYFLYVLYVVYLFGTNIKNMKQLDIFQRIIIGGFFLASLIYISVYIIHNVHSGYYHDINGTGPSDGEKNFQFIELLLAYITLLISHTTYSRKQ